MPDRDEADIEARVSRLESEVERLREDVGVSRAGAAAARVLAGGADRDVSDTRTELRAHTQALSALRETQIEQGEQISGLRSEMQQGFGMLQTGMAQIVALLDIRKADESG
jgi:chromosome segregation ATPase